ncbi:MAG TPA: hypothetical protein VM933_01645 [Acidimicrobiales bacterium]|nr:hypothetical protein [Acidimicrobiales bacterium]
MRVVLDGVDVSDASPDHRSQDVVSTALRLPRVVRTERLVRERVEELLLLDEPSSGIAQRETEALGSLLGVPMARTGRRRRRGPKARAAAMAATLTGRG